jgi:hypothetical protein
MLNKTAVCKFVIAAACVLCGSIITACVQVQNPADSVNFSFTSPRPNSVYYQDELVLLALNINTQNILWRSSMDGELGAGNHIPVFLSSGRHTISARVDTTEKSAEIEIRSRNLYQGTEIKNLVTYVPLIKHLSPNGYFPYALALNYSANGLEINAPKSVSNRQDRELRPMFSSCATDAPVVRDIHLNLPAFSNDALIAPTERHRMTSQLLSQQLHSIGEKRNFFVVNTSSQYMPPHELEAELFYYSDSVTLWITAGTDIDIEALNYCIEALESVILFRINTLWGTSADIDNDGRLAILISSTINDEELALGFFNPSDFFKQNTDSASDNYNPSSNEMDIIYVAVPSSLSDNTYHYGKIIATLAHEITHAVTFTKKTWLGLFDSNTNNVREELFLDEGWSHLSENLCGYGVTGGNFLFLNRFFEDTASYSLTGKNKWGYEDSAGMRGAVTLFLSWLFWKKGGITWDADNPVGIIDNGGIAFLYNMLDLPDTGWESIGQAYGEQTDILFQRMITEINTQRIFDRKYQYKTDPLTSEPVDFFSNMDMYIAGNLISIGFPAIYNSDNNSGYSLEPRSFMFFQPLNCDIERELVINTVSYNGAFYYNYGIGVVDY